MLKIRLESEIGGDLFAAPEEFKVVTVNCVGAMGRGIALSCKQLYPSIYEDYRARCRKGNVGIGTLLYYPGVILLPTKLHFKDPSHVEYIREGLATLVASDNPFTGGVAIPPLGMANGWLRQQQRFEVYRALVDYLRADERRFTLYLPTALYEECRIYLTGKRN